MFFVEFVIHTGIPEIGSSVEACGNVIILGHIDVVTEIKIGFQKVIHHSDSVILLSCTRSINPIIGVIGEIIIEIGRAGQVQNIFQVKPHSHLRRNIVNRVGVLDTIHKTFSVGETCQK